MMPVSYQPVDITQNGLTKDYLVEEKKSKKDYAFIDDGAFNFPFQPYSIQLEFMQAAYDTFEQSKFALLESPTGTGKSLSLICSALTWLKRFQLNRKNNLDIKAQQLSARIDDLIREEELSSDWISVQAKIREANKTLEQVKSDIDRLKTLEDNNTKRWLAWVHQEQTTKTKNDEKVTGNKRNIDELYEDSISSCDTNVEDEFLVKEELYHAEKRPDDALVENISPKIYYASRTHTQLNQFVNEVKRTKFTNKDSGPPIRLVQLASRSSYCINPSVKKLKDPSAINDKCKELKNETNAAKRCPFLKPESVNMLKETLMTQVHDLEDTITKAINHRACPYYATRTALAEAEVVVLPYNNLFHQETRKAISLDLKDSLVIVDEAHNVLDTICSIHSATITGQQLVLSHLILTCYYRKYRKRLKPSNLDSIKQIVACLSSMIKFLDSPKKHIDLNSSIVDLDLSNGTDKDDQSKPENSPAPIEEFSLDVRKFISVSNLGDHNIFKFIDFLVRNQLPRKLQGFYFHFIQSDDKMHENTKAKKPPLKKIKSHTKNALKDSQDTKKVSGNIPISEKTKNFINNTTYPIYILIEFLKNLTDYSGDGRVITRYAKSDLKSSSLKFLLLNPSNQFKQMVTSVRSLILAGGTMQPFEEFTDLLFGPLEIDRKRINIFSCGHIIPKDNLFVATLVMGPSSKKLELSYQTRQALDVIDEYGRTIANLSMIVPGGMVCFLPSYSWESICFDRWKQKGIIATIEDRSKTVFREPKQANQVTEVLDEYAVTIKRGKESNRGALLFSVVGGKVSEGINFNDDLGRCVVMVGLPYANIKSVELSEKITYFTKVRGNSDSTSISDAGQQYYQNLCIKGINQSIGRAIRHKDDYAAIILLDRRFSSSQIIRSGLPKWIGSSLEDHEKFGGLFSQLKGFYRNIDAKLTSNQPK